MFQSCKKKTFRFVEVLYLGLWYVFFTSYNIRTILWSDLKVNNENADLGWNPFLLVKLDNRLSIMLAHLPLVS
jgi:hypothetical protein